MSASQSGWLILLIPVRSTGLGALFFDEALAWQQLTIRQR
jgi:hypothetical protein